MSDIFRCVEIVSRTVKQYLSFKRYSGFSPVISSERPSRRVFPVTGPQVSLYGVTAASTARDFHPVPGVDRATPSIE